MQVDASQYCMTYSIVSVQYAVGKSLMLLYMLHVETAFNSNVNGCVLQNDALYPHVPGQFQWEFSLIIIYIYMMI